MRENKPKLSWAKRVQNLCIAGSKARTSGKASDRYSHLSSTYGLVREAIDNRRRRALMKALASPLKTLPTPAEMIDGLIDASAGMIDRRSKWKYSATVTFATVKEVEVEDFVTFVKQHRGISGCARKMAKIRKKPKPKS